MNESSINLTILLYTLVKTFPINHKIVSHFLYFALHSIEMGKMKALALINSGSENALFLFCPGTSEEQLQRAGTGAELLVLEQIIPIKPDVDMQQQARDRKRASMVEESEVGIYITSKYVSEQLMLSTAQHLNFHSNSYSVTI